MLRPWLTLGTLVSGVVLALVAAALNPGRQPLTASPAGHADDVVTHPTDPSGGATATASAARARNASPTPTPASSPDPRPSVVDCGYPSGFDCAMQQGIVAAAAFAGDRPGVFGVVVHDRVTGATWSNRSADTLVWAASTTKLAMTVDLLLRERAGEIALRAVDRRLIHRMLNVSDDAAASILWDRYGGEDFATRFPRYGLTSATFVPGYPRRWGYMKCTALDLERLVRFVLERLPEPLRTQVVAEMRSVGANQQWGVWGAGSTNHPGNKNGWTTSHGSRILNSAGFAGPGARYTIALTNERPGLGDFDAGTRAESRLAALLFSREGKGPADDVPGSLADRRGTAPVQP